MPLILTKVQNREIFYLVVHIVKLCFLLMYIKSAWFQLENWDAQAWLGSHCEPQNLPGLAQLREFQLELITTISLVSQNWTFGLESTFFLVQKMLTYTVCVQKLVGMTQCYTISTFATSNELYHYPQRRVKGDFLVQDSDVGGLFGLLFWNLHNIWI